MSTLKELRLEANLTQKQLAQLVGVSERTIIFWEVGSVFPSFEALQSLYQVLGPDVYQAFQISQPSRKRGRQPKGKEEQQP
jgi:DNA-binding XRE family transcriptional regulator